MMRNLLLPALMATAYPVVAMPDVNCDDNTMVLTSLQPAHGEEPMTLPLRCGFYGESDAQYLELFLCVGELYEAEGQPFYSDDLFDTRFIEVILPWDQVGTEMTVGGETSLVGFYDMITDSWLCVADEGKLSVKRSEEGHLYEVELQVVDHEQGTKLEAHMCQTEQWRWRDVDEERPNPNQFELKRDGIVQEHHDLLSCVVDERDPDLPVFYLADQPNLTSVSEVMALDEAQYVIIQMPTELMDGLIKGFSGWSDDALTVRYKGVDYNHSGCLHDETCYGGNVAMEDFDHDTKHISISSMIFTMIQEDYRNMNLHYDGSFVVDGENCIHSVRTDTSAAKVYDLWGRPFNPGQGRGFLVQKDINHACIYK